MEQLSDRKIGLCQYVIVTRKSAPFQSIELPTEFIISNYSHGQGHGVPGEDVVATEILLLSKADPPSHSHLHHLGQDCWAGERGYKKVFFLRLNVISDL